MKKKEKKKPAEKKLISGKKAAIISTILVAIIVSGFLLFRVFLPIAHVEFPMTAAIIDQIGENPPSSPNSAHVFNETVSSILQNTGFTVYYHRSQSVTVELFRNLTKNNYGIIILRTHAALRRGETTIDFFTSEPYSGGKYTDEMNKGFLTRGNYSWETGKYYYAVTPKFIENLEGSFPKSIIISMGCWSLATDYDEMAQAFIKKGAGAYIGWTDSLLMPYDDNSTIRFLQYFFEKDMTVSQAVYECNKIHDPDDPVFVSGKLHPFSLTELTYSPARVKQFRFSDFKAESS
jgi:hypothetical protein